MSFNTQQIKLENRLTRLEESLANMHTDILSIKDNHLTSIYSKLETSRNLTVGLLVGLVMNLIGVMVAIVLKK